MNYTDISTRHWRYIFNVVIHLHANINGHLLRRYTFAVASASSDVTERQSCSAQPGRREDTDVFCLVLFLFVFHGRFQTRNQMSQTTPVTLLITPSSAHAGKLCAMTTWSKFSNTFNVQTIHHLILSASRCPQQIIISSVQTKIK